MYTYDINSFQFIYRKDKDLYLPIHSNMVVDDKVYISRVAKQIIYDVSLLCGILVTLSFWVLEFVSSVD